MADYSGGAPLTNVSLLTGLGTSARRWFEIGITVQDASYFALLCVLTGCLGIYFLMRLMETIKRSGRNLWMVTDISDTCWSRADADPSRPCSHLPTAPCNGRRTGIEILSGASIWRERRACVAIQAFLVRQYR